MKIEGREALKRKLKAMPQVARTEIRKALEQSAREIVDAAKGFAPAQSGALRNSIDFTFGDYKPANSNVRGATATGGKLGDKDLTVTVHAGDETAFYAAFVEFGTAPHQVGGLYAGATHPGSSPRPFFFPAYRLTRKRVKGRITRATNKAAKKVAAGGGS